jgi:nucleoside-diphosphate-sugar epimerase
MGTHMVEVLHEAGYPIRATDLGAAYEKDDQKAGRFPSVLKRLGVEFIPSDLTEPPSLDPVVKDVKFCFHVAAVFSYSAPFSVLEQVNYHGTKELLDRLLAQATFSKLVMWGAGGVYDLDAPIPYKEDETPLAPANNYLKSKHMAEQLVMEYGREKGLRYSIMRPTTVYGPRCVYGAGQMFQAAASGPVGAIPSNFTGRIPFVHVRDVVGAAKFLAENPSTDGEVYNLNDSSELTNIDFFKFVADITGRPFVKLPPIPVQPLKKVLAPLARGIEWAAGKAGAQAPIEADTLEYLGRDFTYSNQKLLDAGYEFIYPDARQGIADTILWYQRNGWL